jgi:hypothetical protein
MNSLSLARHYKQSILPYSYEYIINPGSWHLSFFGGVGKIKNKLKSYSHQNFISQFINNNNNNNNNNVDLNMNKEDENFPKYIPKYEDLSIELIESKINSGLEIDYRNKKKCKSIQLNNETIKLKNIYNKINLSLNNNSIHIDNNINNNNDDNDLNNNEMDNKDKYDIAFVSGFIGSQMTTISEKPHSQHDCYFITNNIPLSNLVEQHGWIAIRLTDVDLLDSTLSTYNYIYNSLESKHLKVFPQKHLLKQYDLVVWFDNKFNLFYDNIMDTINDIKEPLSLSPIALIVPLRPCHPTCIGVISEYQEGMHQERYLTQKDKLYQYMIEESEISNFSLTDGNLYNTAFLIYNMHNELTKEIQERWYSHIDRSGILCQVSFYFISLYYPHNVVPFIKNWNFGRMALWNDGIKFG